jgi:hypothetical protein
MSLMHSPGVSLCWALRVLELPLVGVTIQGNFETRTAARRCAFCASVLSTLRANLCILPN